MKKPYEIKTIPIKVINFDGLQPRQVIRDRELEDLARDIKARGQLYPILVMEKNNKFNLLDGERRTRACLLNGATTIEAKVLDINLLEGYEIQFVSNFKRSQIELRETAKAIVRFKEEFVKQYPDEDPIVRLVELTGFSRTYFESAEAINRTSGEFKDAIYSGHIGDYTAREIEGATKNEASREGLREGYVIAKKNGKKISALASRPLKKQLKDLESRTYKEEEKKEIAKGLLLKTYGLLNGNGKSKGNYLVYLETVLQWQSDLKAWNLTGLEERELKNLAGEIANLLTILNEKRRVSFGKLKPNKLYHLSKVV